jgi:hypothetical protein
LEINFNCNVFSVEKQINKILISFWQSLLNSHLCVRRNKMK